MASAWDNGPQPTSASAASDAVDHAWWKTLGDPAVDALVEAALIDNPTLGQAIARMDQARATARVSDAQRLPQISVNGSVARARTGGDQTGGGALTTQQSTATLDTGRPYARRVGIECVSMCSSRWHPYTSKQNYL